MARAAGILTAIGLVAALSGLSGKFAAAVCPGGAAEISRGCATPGPGRRPDPAPEGRRKHALHLPVSSRRDRTTIAQRFIAGNWELRFPVPEGRLKAAQR